MLIIQSSNNLLFQFAFFMNDLFYFMEFLNLFFFIYSKKMIRLIRFDLSDSNFFSMKFFIFSSFLFYYNDKQLKAMILLLINSIAVNSRSAIFWFNYVGLLLERTFNMRKSEFNNELNIFFYYSLYLKKNVMFILQIIWG